LLECVGVSKEFGGIQALKKVDLTVKAGEIAGLVGPNGSGKSTLLNLISGVYRPDSGKVIFMGQDISKLPPYTICSRGISKTAQTAQSFPDLTAVQNVLIGVLFSRKKGDKSKGAIDEAAELLRFSGVKEERFNLPAKNLNVVELRRVQLARALATQPRLLLLDELLTGLTPAETEEAAALVRLIRNQGVTILMVEHIMKVIMGLCDRVTVLNHGEKICEGTPEKVCSDKNVVNVYLGTKYKFDED